VLHVAQLVKMAIIIIIEVVSYWLKIL